MSFVRERCGNGVRNVCAVALAGICMCGIPDEGRSVELVPPVALGVTDVVADGFIAHWSAVPEATGYSLDVWRVDVAAATVCEGFDGYPGVTPQGWAIANANGSYTSVSSSGQSIPSVRLEASGHAITTPIYPAAVTNLSFWYKGSGSSNSSIQIGGSNTTGWVALGTLPVSNSATVTNFTLSASDGYVRFRLTYNKGSGNVGIDDVTVSYGDGAKTFAVSNVPVGNVTSHAVTGLTPGVYFYAVRALDGSNVSPDSNAVMVDTEAPPQIADPVALAATDVAADSFTANWNAVFGADGYLLNVWRFDGVPPTTVREGFDGYPDATPQGWAIANAGHAYTSGASSGQAIPSVQLEATGHAITTPVYPAAVTNLSFWYKGGSVSNSFLQVEGSNAMGWITLDVLPVSNSAAVTNFMLEAMAGFTQFRLVYNKDRGNVGIDDVSVSYGSGMREIFLEDVEVGNATSYALTDLEPGVYCYAVRAFDGGMVSAESSMVEVDMLIPPPPIRLAVPVALDATDVVFDGFTANWSVVPDMDGYLLDVWRFDGVPPTTVSEGFDGYPGVTPQGWTIENIGSAYTADSSSGLNIPAVCLEATGHAITTPIYPAAVTNLSFWYRGSSVSNSFLRVEGNDTTEWNMLGDVPVSGSATITNFMLSALDGYTRFRLTYTKDKGNVGIDDVNVSYGGGATAFVLSNAVVGNVTSYAVTGLTPGVYFYAVRTTQGDNVSGNSNVITVDTDAPPTPPRVAPVAAQTVRVGETLSFTVNVAATEGDPVTATNVTASAGVAGAWELTDGVFTYTPVAGDVGERVFTFTAQDKDGWSDAMAVTVRVRPAQVVAISMTNATGSYTQDFNALALSGQANVWDNAVEPLAAWYAYTRTEEVTAYRTSPGSGTSGGVYSFGTANSANRALGSLAASGNTIRYGVAFTNAIGLAVTNLAVRFKAEQWRVGASALTNTLVFEYCVTNRVLPLYQSVWRRVNALCFDSPLVTNGTQSAGAVSAVVPVALTANITRPIPPAGIVMLRWSDVDDTNGDHGFGIDDVEVEWTAGAMPIALTVSRAGIFEDFDEMGEGSGGALPWSWRVETRDDAPRASGPYAAAVEQVAYTNRITTASVPGSYCFVSGASRDQAVGGVLGALAKSVSVSAKFRNGTDAFVRRWNVRFAVEKYRNGLIGCTARLLFSTDGMTWIAAGEPVAFAADADTSPINPDMTVAVERRVVFDEPVAPGGTFYLAWQISATEGNTVEDAQALAIDDVFIEPILSRYHFLMLK